MKRTLGSVSKPIVATVTCAARPDARSDDETSPVGLSRRSDAAGGLAPTSPLGGGPIPVAGSVSRLVAGLSKAVCLRAPCPARASAHRGLQAVSRQSLILALAILLFSAAPSFAKHEKGRCTDGDDWARLLLQITLGNDNCQPVCEPAPCADARPRRVTRHCDAPVVAVDRDCHRHCEPVQVWVPGHYETRCQEVVIPGYYKTEYVQPVYEYRYDCHCRAYTRVCVREGYYTQVWIPERRETREVQVWVPGHYETR